MNTLPLLTPLSQAPDGVPVDVAQEFLACALKTKNAGLKRYSAKTICEVIRWHRSLEHHNREFKLNNNWTALLARWAMEVRPELRGFFETRERTV